MRYEELTEEQKAKLEACKTPEEFLKLAADEEIALTDEELEAISGGGEWYGATWVHCYHCNMNFLVQGSQAAMWHDKHGYDKNYPFPCPTCGRELDTRI